MTRPYKMDDEERDRARNRSRDIRKFDPDRAANYQLRARYGRGIDLAWVNERIRAQGYKCPLCERGPLAWGRGRQRRIGHVEAVVDHCHESGLVRAVLCVRCNLRLPAVDDPAWVSRALASLGAHKRRAAGLAA